MRLHSNSMGSSYGYSSHKPERDKWCVNASHSRRPIFRPDEGQRDRNHASHEAQGQAPGRGTIDTDQSSLNFDISGGRWKEEEEVFWLRSSYISILMFNTVPSSQPFSNPLPSQSP